MAIDSNYTLEIRNSVCNRGLVALTKSNNYAINNLNKGCTFSGYKEGFYYYSSDKKATEIKPTMAKRLEDNRLKDPIYIQDDKGHVYGLDEVKNRDPRTLEDFTKLGELLRETNIGKNYSNFENKYDDAEADSAARAFHLSDYSDGIFFSDAIKDEVRGEEYAVSEGKLPSQKSPINVFSTKFWDDSLYYNDYLRILTHSEKDINDEYNRLSIAKSAPTTLIENASPSPFFNKKIGEKVENLFVPQKRKSIDESANVIRNWILGTRSAVNPLIREALSKNTNSGHNFRVKNNFGDEIDFSHNQSDLKIDNSNISREGIYSYYKAYREEKNMPKFYSILAPYAIKPLENFDRYSINDNKSTFSESIIDISSTSTDRPIEKNGRYNFYEGESDNEGEKPTLKNTSTSDKMYINLSDFKGTSRLLEKTNQLFKERKIHSLINRFHTEQVEKSDIISAYDSQYGMSRGRNLLVKGHNANTSTGYEDPYCRVWTAHHQYSRFQDRIRPFYDEDGNHKSVEDLQKELYGSGENGKGLRPNEGAKRLGQNTVLQDNGFVKIAPHGEGQDLAASAQNNIKRCMFSIENLAWKGILKNEAQTVLSKSQVGPNHGRIMWFPPYNLKFTENVNVSWNSNQFIGRGEQIYTYTNTERNGTLNFTLLIDHPSAINKWARKGADINDIKEAQDDLLRFFAGCGTLDNISDSKGKESDDVAPVDERGKQDPKPQIESKDITYVIFFSNDFSGYDYSESKKGTTEEDTIELWRKLENYEYSSNPPFTERDASYSKEILDSSNIENRSIYRLNNNTEHDSEIKKILFGTNDEKMDLKHLSDFETLPFEFDGSSIFGMNAQNFHIEYVNIQGFASSHGYEKKNIELCNRRRNVIKELIKKSCPITEDMFRPIDGKIIKMADTNNDVNSFEAKVARAAIATFHISWDINTTPSEEPKTEGITSVSNLKLDLKSDEIYGGTLDAAICVADRTTIVSNDEYAADSEYLYFSSLEDGSNSLVLDNIVHKVKCFNPAFHSITPEGFNARLNFLHQCTRQGPTTTANGGYGEGAAGAYLKYAGNLGFGRAPYCILRIGDFFNTKICIDSMSIDYDTGGGIQWDLNPEGAGVQPMYANVSLNFKFIGGQDISGPIERLQNAITSNYYANTSVYDNHSDTESEYFDATTNKRNVKN